MTIREMLRDDFQASGETGREVVSLVYDSRKAGPGSLFVALKGETVDGRNYIEDALSRGAVAVAYEKGDQSRKAELERLMGLYPDVAWIGLPEGRDGMAYLAHAFYRRPSEDLCIVGITGTNGKTTTSYLIRSILERWGKTTGLIGTISYLIGGQAHDAPHTTPEAPDLQALLREMAEGGCTHVAAEVSSHALSQRRADYTRFCAAVFTNLTRDHLDYHGTMEEYYLAKERLFTELLVNGGTAVVITDDPYGLRLAGAVRCAEGRDLRLITCGLNEETALLRASDVRAGFEGTVFRLKSRGSADSGVPAIDEEISSPLIGAINVYNVLAAVGAALSLKIPMNVIKEGIAMTSLVKGRFEKVDVGQDFLAVVDYAHTEDALERLLTTARQLLEAYRVMVKTEKMIKAKRRDFSVLEEKERGRIITVFGCGGNRDRGKRTKMGEIASRLSDFVILTSDNPRNEDPKRILKEIEKGMHGDNYIIIPDRSVAISMAVELASAGDIVLVAGKGHEDYQEIQGARHSFSDRTALESAIRRAISRPAFGGGSNFRGTETARC